MTQPTWLFDLDNTLHNANPHIFPHINRAMTAYLETHLQLDTAAAGALRVHYWHRYGATLSGLMRHHGTDPEHFLWHTHQFPELQRMLVADRALRHHLRGLPGRKYLFTNAPRHYAEAVLAALGISDLFAGVIAIQDLQYRPKPQPQGYRTIKGWLPRRGRVIMVDDALENLRTARRLGWRTVWASTSARMPAGIDARMGSLGDLRRLLPRLLA